MVRIPINPPGLRKKLDGQWVKGVWVGRMDENDGGHHVRQVREEVEPGVEDAAEHREDDQDQGVGPRPVPSAAAEDVADVDADSPRGRVR